MFIDDTLKRLSTMSDYQPAHNRLVCLICVLIVKEVFTSCFSEKLYQEQKEKLDSKEHGSTIYAKLIVEKYGTDALSTEAIEHELQERKIYGKRLLIIGLYNYFKYYDCSYFVEKATNKRLLEKKLFYYSDKDKITVIKSALNCIYDDLAPYDTRQIYEAFLDIFRHNNGILQEDDFNNLAKSILKTEETKKQELINYFEEDMHFEHSKDEENFVKILKNILSEQDKNSFLQYLKGINLDKYDSSLINWIHKLQKHSDSLHPEIVHFLKENKFLLPDLSKSISENAWTLCHDMCNFVVKVDISLKNDLIDILNKQLESHPDLKCVKERVDALKKHKLGEK